MNEHIPYSTPQLFTPTKWSATMDHRCSTHNLFITHIPQYSTSYATWSIRSHIMFPLLHGAIIWSRHSNVLLHTVTFFMTCRQPIRLMSYNPSLHNPIVLQFHCSAVLQGSQEYILISQLYTTAIIMTYNNLKFPMSYNTKSPWSITPHNQRPG